LQFNHDDHWLDMARDTGGNDIQHADRKPVRRYRLGAAAHDAIATLRAQSALAPGADR
jgi:hypothetical protein